MTKQMIRVITNLLVNKFIAEMLDDGIRYIIAIL